MIITSSSSLDDGGGGDGSETRLRLDLRIGSGEGEVVVSEVVVIVEIMTDERRREGIFTLKVMKVGSEIKMGEFWLYTGEKGYCSGE